MFVWGLVGNAKECSLSSICLEELVGGALFKYLEYGTSMSNVVNLAGT